MATTNLNRLPRQFQPLTSQYVKELEEDRNRNPFIEVNESIYLLARLAVVIFLVSMIYLGVTSRDAAPNMPLRLLVASLRLLVVTLPLWCKIKGIGILHPLYFLSALAFLKTLVPSLYLMANGVSFHGALPGSSPRQISMLQIQILGLSALSFACMYAGFFLNKGNGWTFVRFREKNAILFVGAVVALVVGSIALWWIMEMSGGLSYHLKNISRGRTKRIWVKDPTYASIYASFVPLILVPPVLWILKRKGAFYSPILWTLCIYAAASGYLVSGRRTSAITNVIAMLACWILHRKKLALGRVAIVAMLAFLSVGIIGEFRKSNWRRNQSLDFGAVTESSVNDSLAKSWEAISERKKGSAAYPIIAKVPEKEPFRYGAIYLSYFNRFIPRIIWPNKPNGVGVECAYVFYGRVEQGGIPPGGVGEAYWSAGVFGVVVVFFIWGFVLRCIANFFLKFHKSAPAVLLYLATLTKLGPSEPQFRAWLFLVVPAAMLLALAGIIQFRPAKRSSS